MLTNEEALQIFRDSGALLEGHFLLASGYHSAQYLEKFQVLQFPHYVERLCADLAERFADDEIDVVLGPTTGGVLLAYEVAKKLGTRGIFAERVDDGKGRILRRGFELREGERVLVVDDILTTGGSVRDTIEVVEGWGATLVGVGVLADRSGGKIDFGVPLEAILSLDIPKYAPDALPDWLAAIPLTERGSTHHLKTKGAPHEDFGLSTDADVAASHAARPRRACSAGPPSVPDDATHPERTDAACLGARGRSGAVPVPDPRQP